MVLTEIKDLGSIGRKNGEMCYCGQNAGVIKPQNALSCKRPLREQVQSLLKSVPFRELDFSDLAENLAIYQKKNSKISPNLPYRGLFSENFSKRHFLSYNTLVTIFSGESIFVRE